jgi:hypothetical protein
MRPRTVVDASAALHLVIDRKNSEQIADRLDEADLVTAPDLFTCEVANGLLGFSKIVIASNPGACAAKGSSRIRCCRGWWRWPGASAVTTRRVLAQSRPQGR